MSDLPRGWAVAKLGDLGDYLNGRGFKKSEWRESGRPIIRIQNLTGSGQAFNYFDGEPDESYTARSGDVLLSWAATLGIFVWRGPEAVVNQHIFKVESAIDREFHRYLLDSVLADLRRETHGSGMVHITRTKFVATQVLLPPLNEQRRIVAAIEEQFSRLDSAGRSVLAVEARLSTLRASLLGEATAGWPLVPIGRVGRVFVGSTPSRRRQDLWGGGVAWVSSGEVAFSRISTTRETISVTASKVVHPPGTVLLAMIGEGRTRGQAAILDVEAAHNQNSAAIRLDPGECIPEWLFYCLMATYEATRKAGVGGQQPALNRSRVEALTVPMPPVEEQPGIVVEIERRLSLLDSMRGTIDAARRRGASLRRSILERAFRGELVPQDSSDEPASVLLDRICAERAALPKTARSRRRAGTAPPS